MPFPAPTLDQAQTALADALEPLTTGVINTPKQVWALEVLQLFAVAKFMDIPDSGVVKAKAENEVFLTKAELMDLLTKWSTLGNVNVSTAHPSGDPSLIAGINWRQLVGLILPLLLNEMLKRIAFREK